MNCFFSKFESMKFTILFVTFLLISGIGISQDSISGITEKQGEDILIGKVDRNSLQQGEFGQYFREQYRYYEPCTNALQQIQKDVYEHSIVIVLGTWCHDSQLQVGRFYKILDLLDYNTNTVTNICLDRDKLAGELGIDNYDIKLVPTFIFYNNSKETGRIIESPQTSLEKDIVQILNR